MSACERGPARTASESPAKVTETSLSVVATPPSEAGKKVQDHSGRKQTESFLQYVILRCDVFPAGDRRLYGVLRDQPHRALPLGGATGLVSELALRFHAESLTTPSAPPPTHKVTPSRIPSKSPAPKVVTTPAPVGRDANGFALGGPPQPSSPANYDHPSHSDCQRFLTQLRAWSTYQNQHRPAGSTNYLPSSGEVQYLFVVCGLRY
jgi:hypothetical protein